MTHAEANMTGGGYSKVVPKSKNMKIIHNEIITNMYLTFQHYKHWIICLSFWYQKIVGPGYILRKSFLETYTSPSLFIFQFKKNKEQINFVKANLLGWGLHPESFPIRWHCKLDTGMCKSNMHPKLQIQQMLWLDLLLRLASLTSLVPIWHAAPSWMNHSAKRFT